MNETGFELVAADASVLWMSTRIPFRYGIATLTELPHLFLRVTLRPQGSPHQVYGVAADGLLPKWFDKNPATTGQEDLANMWASIAKAIDNALTQRHFSSGFDLWWTLYNAQGPWGEKRGFPALLWHFGVTLVERAVIDALCRAADRPVSEMLKEGRLGLDPALVAPDLPDGALAEILQASPLERIAVRHTVGMSDPLTSQDLEEPIQDGLPETLEEDIRTYRLSYFKIKVRGDLEPDIERLSQIAELFSRLGVSDFRFSLDGNEQFRDAESFRVFFEAVASNARLSEFFQRLLFVEQPFARAIALEANLGRGLKAWKDRPAIIIDESDGSIGDVKRALALGYSGSSYKNCKGVFKGILNAARIRAANTSEGRAVLLSGEDLANVGPVALLQDLAMMAKLGIGHVERNGHHYFRGLSRFSPELQQQMLTLHGDLYHPIAMVATGRQSEEFYPTLRIVDGALSNTSVTTAPFGVVPIPEETEYRPFLETACPQMKG